LTNRITLDRTDYRHSATHFLTTLLLPPSLVLFYLIASIAAGYDVTVVDNLVNANAESLRRVQTITKCDDTRLR
jgi:hypothetical protein